MWVQGLPHKVLEDEGVDVEVLGQAINYLLQKVPCEQPPSLIWLQYINSSGLHVRV